MGDRRLGCLSIKGLEPRRLLSAGDVNPTFGDAGVVSDFAGNFQRANDALLLPPGDRILVAEIDSDSFAGSNPRGVEVMRGGVGDDLFLHDPDTATDTLFGDAGDDTLAGDA